MKDSTRTYWIARHSNGRVFASFSGKNAKRDATRADASHRPQRCKGADLDNLMGR